MIVDLNDVDQGLQISLPEWHGSGSKVFLHCAAEFSQVVDALHALDGGRPLKILTLQRRQRPLTPIEAVHARSLAAGELRGPRAGG